MANSSSRRSSVSDDSWERLADHEDELDDYYGHYDEEDDREAYNINIVSEPPDYLLDASGLKKVNDDLAKTEEEHIKKILKEELDILSDLPIDDALVIDALKTLEYLRRMHDDKQNDV